VRGEGSIVFKPQEMPTFEAHAAVHLGTLEGRADLVGQGKIHHKDSLWLEGTLDYVTANNPLKLIFPGPTMAYRKFSKLKFTIWEKRS
jgi:hypothetical protein